MCCHIQQYSNWKTELHGKPSIKYRGNYVNTRAEIDKIDAILANKCYHIVRELYLDSLSRSRIGRGSIIAP